MIKVLAITVDHGVTKVAWNGNALQGVKQVTMGVVPQVILAPAPPGPLRTAQWNIAQDMRANGYVVLFEIGGLAQEELPGS